MIAHLDTVFPPEEEERNNFRWQPEGDRIYGPGTEDVKGGTMMMWLVLKALERHAPDTFNRVTWKLFWNSSEEQFSPDFGDVCRGRLDKGTVAALVFEAEGHGNGERRLVLARKGRGTYRITARGRGAHAGGDHARGANAIAQLSRVIEQVSALTDYSRQLTFNVGHIAGGTGLNRVPHEAVALGEFRAFSPEVYHAAKAALLALNGPGSVRSPQDGCACEVKVEILAESRPWPRNAATAKLFAHWESAARVLNLPTGFEERGGLSDGNSLWDAVPTLDGLGPSGDNSHSSERSPDGTKLPEYVVASSFVPKALLNVTAILRLLEHG
jgi:glutamate carboxypeptidase